MDEAFKSRIHYKIYYPELTLEQTLDIWKLNMQRVRRIEGEMAKVEKRQPLFIDEDQLIGFAVHQFHEGNRDKRRPSRWNGRQIRNAFQVARSLAYYDHGIRQEQQQVPVGPPRLDVHYFETMHEIAASFENYRTATSGGMTDGEIALEAGYRDDKYRDGLTEDLQAVYRNDHLRANAGAADIVADESDPNNTSDMALRPPSL